MGDNRIVLEAYIPRLGSIRVRLASWRDREKLVRFFENLSETSISLRFLSYTKDFRSIVDRMISSSESALGIIAEYRDRIVGVGELYRLGRDKCEAAITVSEDYRGLCIGTTLLYTLLLIAHSRGVKEIVGYIHASNTPMFSILDRLGGRRTLSYSDVVAGYLLVDSAIEKAREILVSKGVKLSVKLPR